MAGRARWGSSPRGIAHEGGRRSQGGRGWCSGVPFGERSMRPVAVCEKTSRRHVALRIRATSARRRAIRVGVFTIGRRGAALRPAPRFSRVGLRTSPRQARAPQLQPRPRLVPGAQRVSSPCTQAPTTANSCENVLPRFFMREGGLQRVSWFLTTSLLRVRPARYARSPHYGARCARLLPYGPPSEPRLTRVGRGSSLFGV